MAQTLTARQRQVICRLAVGRTSKDVANELGLSVHTVECHRNRVYRKLGAKGNAVLTFYCLAQGWIKNPYASETTEAMDWKHFGNQSTTNQKENHEHKVNHRTADGRRSHRARNILLQLA